MKIRSFSNLTAQKKKVNPVDKGKLNFFKARVAGDGKLGRQMDKFAKKIVKKLKKKKKSKHKSLINKTGEGGSSALTDLKDLQVGSILGELWETEKGVEGDKF